MLLMKFLTENSTHPYYSKNGMLTSTNHLMYLLHNSTQELMFGLHLLPTSD